MSTSSHHTIVDHLHVAKSDLNSSATVSAICAVSDFLDLAKLIKSEGEKLATNWIKDRPKGLKLQNLVLATITGPALCSYPSNTTADVHNALENCDSLGSEKQLILHGTPSAIANGFSPSMSVLRRHFLPNMLF